MDETKGTSGLSIAALILGILSILCCCIGFPFSIAGIILAVIVLVKEKPGKGMAIAGLIMSVITLLISIVFAIRITPILPYFGDIIKFSKDPGDEIVEYQEEGVYPEVVENLIEDGVFSEDDAKVFMDSFIQGYNTGIGAGE